MIKGYVTYNSRSELGRQTAFRVQTLANLYGHTIYLPARNCYKKVLSETTKERIADSNVIIAIGVGRLSRVLKWELEYALQQNKPVVFISDTAKGLPVALRDVCFIVVDLGCCQAAITAAMAFISQHFYGTTKAIVQSFVLCAIILLLFDQASK